MKKIFIISLVFNIFTLNAQYKKGKIFLKNKEFKIGLIKTRGLGGIKFKKNEEVDVEIYDYKKIIGYDILEKGTIKYRYKTVLSGTPRIMRIVRLGKINLYSISQDKREVITGIKYDNRFIYFIEKNDITYRVGNKISKKNLKLFDDCPLLIKKLKKKEYKKKEIYKIVNFYNNNCD